jgi:hypothetical protein
LLSLEEFLTEPRKWDFFICCGSFEDRCERSSAILLDKKVELGTSIIFNYKETDIMNKKEENVQKIKANLKNISKYVYIFDTESVSSPSEGIKNFLILLKGNNIDLLDKDIVIDITVLTKPYFFLLFKVLREKFNLCLFYVIYTEPEKYKSKSSNKNEIILTEGLDRIESIPAFWGSSANPKDALIVILGFEGKRSLEVFYNINPEMSYAINGFPSFQPGWHKISIENNLRFLRESGASSLLFFAPAVDPFETKRVVCQIAKEIGQDFNIVIAPLGTKMQAFGVLLCALQNPSIKVIYPFPSVYKADYSYKFGPTWILKVDFDKLMEG